MEQQLMVSQQAILKDELNDLIETRAGWIDMGRVYVDNLIRITQELGHRVSNIRTDGIVFCTDNVTLIYYNEPIYITDQRWGLLETIFITCGKIVERKGEHTALNSDAQFQLRQYRVACLHRADYDPEEIGKPFQHEIFVPAFRGWLDEVISYLPDANHRVELRVNAALEADKKRMCNELLMPDHPIPWLT